MTEKMTTLYKITRLDLTTYGGFQYTPKAWTPTLTGRGDICGSGWYHAYTHPGLALLLNPIHGNYSMPFRLWRAEGVIGINDHGLKVGITRLRLVQELQMPTITTESRVSFALLAALAVYPTSAAFTQWAESWLSGADRTEAAASEASAAAARAAARAAEAAAVAARAGGAAEMAAMAARAAEAAARAAWAAEASAMAARAVEAAARAAEAAAVLIDWADAALIGCEFISLGDAR